MLEMGCGRGVVAEIIFNARHTSRSGPHPAYRFSARAMEKSQAEFWTWLFLCTAVLSLAFAENELW